MFNRRYHRVLPTPAKIYASAHGFIITADLQDRQTMCPESLTTYRLIHRVLFLQDCDGGGSALGVDLSSQIPGSASAAKAIVLRVDAICAEADQTLTLLSIRFTQSEEISSSKYAVECFS
jgi:hypothetical protein